MSGDRDVRALLLAAGLGTRLRPVTDTIPKCLVPIHGKPLLDYWLNSLFHGGIERVLINTHYLAGAIEDHLCRSPWKDRVALVHEEELLGTGGTVLANRAFFKERAFLVAHADNLTELDVRAFEASHATRPGEAAISMALFRTDAPETCGIVVLDQRGLVQEFHEKSIRPPGNLANAAVYIFEPEVIDFLARRNSKVVDLSTEVIPAFMGRILGYEMTGYHRDIGSAASLAKAHLEFLPADIQRQ